MAAKLEFNQRDLGHGASETILHPLVAVGLLVTIVLVLWRPRKYAIVPLLLCTFLVPRGQEVYLLGAHLYVRLILVLAGFIRVVRDKFKIAGGLNVIDKIFIVWACYRVFAAIITNFPAGNMEQLQFLLQCLCGYFLLRYLIQDESDVVRTAKTLAVCALILGVSMLLEQHLGVNLFGAILGGAPIAPEIRNGAPRAQATFGHSILAGCFGATLVPLFIWLWKKSKVSSVLGLVGSTLMVLTANSSTPLLAYVAGILGLLLWPVRNSMKAIRWALVIAIVGLALGMNAPVWYIIAHINVIGGSGGYDRAFLLDTCAQHIKDWWLIGTNQNGSWGYDMWDQSDQFVAEAETGGLIGLICFIAIIVKCYSRLGIMRRRVKPKQQWLLWVFGAIMLSNIFAYFGVAYWDQTQVWWFTLLAMISAMTVMPKRQAAAKTPPALMKFPDEEEIAPEVPATVVYSDGRKAIGPWGEIEL
ncbi:MAG TPA: hypothetical protein VHZ25_11915 [Acidobacteriaceae bacterium]|jgi:hypothetical protein|nr:hypothetical protein [Acidobacteriaceae bacterium]